MRSVSCPVFGSVPTRRSSDLPQAVVLREREHPVIPPGEQPSLLVVLAQEVGQPPLHQVLQGLVLPRVEVDLPPPEFGRSEERRVGKKGRSRGQRIGEGKRKQKE